MGCIYKLKNSPFYWIKYVGADGRPQYESSRSIDHALAKDMLKLREGKIAEGVPITAAAGRLKFQAAADDLLNDFKIKGRKSLDEVERRLRLHLLPYFGRCRMAEIDTAMIRRYIAKRQTDKITVQKARTIRHQDGCREELPEITKPVSNAEINRELQVLKRCFNLAREEGRLLHTPHVPMLKEDNVRKGFLDPQQIQDVLSFLPVELQPVIQFAYITGWRLADEILPLTWNHVDFTAGEVHIDRSKNGEGRVFPMNDDLRALLRVRYRERERLKKAGQIVPWVFWRMVAEGRGGAKKPQPILSLNKAWKAACEAAGYPGRSTSRSAAFRRAQHDPARRARIRRHAAAPFIVTELLEGEDLRQQLNRGALPPPRGNGCVATAL